MAGRKLISIRRRVPETESALYEAAWAALAAPVRDRGAHAWRFRGETDRLLFIEFLEFADGVDPRDDDAVRAALDELERIGAGNSEGWLDAEELKTKDNR